MRNLITVEPSLQLKLSEVFNLKQAGAELGQAQPKLGLSFDWNWFEQG